MHHVAEKNPAYQVAPQPLAETKPRTVSLFRNGANQAVRIPKEFELPGSQAVLRREGNRLILEAVPPKATKGTVAALIEALDALKHLEPIDEEFPDIDAGMLPLDDIVL